ncbi:hypothetical protein SUDANB180_01437 [Streptomyces sp. enrichment culture]
MRCTRAFTELYCEAGHDSILRPAHQPHGLLTRRTSALTVVVVSQGIAGVVLGAILLTLGAAVGFGTVFALIAEASTTVTGLFLALFVRRVTDVTVGGVALAISVRRGGAVVPEGGFPWDSLPARAFVGLADVAANGTYAMATRSGPVTVAAVLASLYPVVTALAARGFLKERPRGIRTAGAGLALLGTLLPATG